VNAPPATPGPLESFIHRWRQSGAAERANFQLFLTELCPLLGVPAPNPTSPESEQNNYVFEFDVTFQLGDGTTAPGRIDLYKRDCFVLEAKQGSDYQERIAKEEALLLSPDAPKKKTKKGTAVRGTREYDDAMIRARGQADRYARNLPAGHTWTPFLIIPDRCPRLPLL
jgi:hypothetical protein